jgi:hypothetical protein
MARFPVEEILFAMPGLVGIPRGPDFTKSRQIPCGINRVEWM